MTYTLQRLGSAATCRSWWFGVVIVIGVIWNGAVLAQTFDSGSDGSDGPLMLNTTGVVDFFVPGTFDPPLDVDGDGVYHFTTITIGEGVTVKMTRVLHGPVTWLATGAVQIDGIIDLNGEGGHTSSQSAVNARPGAGGFSGGHGARDFIEPQPGNGPGGGGIGFSSISGPLLAGGGAGHAVAGANGNNGPGGPAYGNAFLLPLIGGSGGGGGGLRNDSTTGGGGAGGGALLIASSEAIMVHGTIRADGGNGGVTGAGSRGGGGGSGGALRLIAPVIGGNGTLSVNGGAGASAGGNGAPGRLRLEAFQLTFSGQARPTATFSTPGVVTLPPSRTPLRVVSIGGREVPEQPSGSVTMADVAIDAAGEIPLEIAAQGIPPGTTVRVTLISETEGTRFVDSEPLEGTLASSTVTVNVTLSSGISHILVEAMWSP